MVSAGFHAEIAVGGGPAGLGHGSAQVAARIRGNAITQ